MKNYSIILALSVFMLCATSLNAKYGCMDTSMHLSQRFDTKTEHFVSCDCPCDEYAQVPGKQNQCMKCSHLHHAPRMEFMKTSAKGNPEAARWMSLYQPATIATRK